MIKAFKRHRFAQAVFIFLVAPLIIGGCGYTTRSLINLEYRTIYIQAFLNKIDITSSNSVARNYKIYHPLLENDITRQVIKQFTWDGNLRLARKETADLVLEGELIDYRKDALRYTTENNRDVEEYRISLVVNIKLYDRLNNTLLWEEGGFTGDATYLITESETTAISDAVKDLARRIVNRVVDVW